MAKRLHDVRDVLEYLYVHDVSGRWLHSYLCLRAMELKADSIITEELAVEVRRFIDNKVEAMMPPGEHTNTLLEAHWTVEQGPGSYDRARWNIARNLATYDELPLPLSVGDKRWPAIRQWYLERWIAELE